MDVLIGFEANPKELKLDYAGSPQDLRRLVEEAFDKELKVLWIEDGKGRLVCVPLSKLAYIEVEGTAGGKRVGFSVSDG